MRIFISFYLMTILATGVWADTICRQPDTANFGSAVTSRNAIHFVITPECAQDNLAVQKPVSLSVLFGDGNQNSTGPEEVESLPSWTVLFDLDDANLDASDREVINQILPSANVRVSGYTCSIGSVGHNLLLSKQRAENVASYLRTRGVTVHSIEGKGECCPVSASDLSKNRRVLIQEEP